MNIAGTELNLKHKALEIYLSGCRPPHCRGCHNPELHSFDVGTPYQEMWTSLEAKITNLYEAGLLGFIWILGGEPQHQPMEELCDLLTRLRRFDVKIVLWTREDFTDADLIGLADFIKHGRYEADGESWIEPLLGIELANSEQYIERGI